MEMFSIQPILDNPIQSFFTLLMLILLQAVLGFDNLLYISIESKRAPEDKQQYVRRMGIGLAIVLRIVLLFIVLGAVEALEEWDILKFDFAAIYTSGHFNFHSLVSLAGGVFILYTAVKEIHHMISIDHFEKDAEEGSRKSVGFVIFWIVLMNLVFSFDSILSAMALTHDFWIMATAIVISGVLMIVLADTVANFLKKNRLYEVLGLFILFIVGILLVSEGGEHAELVLFSYHVHAMQKSTFYFVIAVLVIIDIVQGRYQKKLQAMKQAETAHAKA
ncbi:TerC family protein [Aeoliella mucimassa]|uniref:Integral membrane protein TerC family protein n=1 Tax=Aeoliella mucimassa TaxID=2527972 RepID=A0A518AIQ2_9BACT|nr:TerC family protein [Aeoliella mucimassa]QDU54618.1 Integral membrane protein TerC family protein [Aeoliella mucimassa]